MTDEPITIAVVPPVALAVPGTFNCSSCNLVKWLQPDE